MFRHHPVTSVLTSVTVGLRLMHLERIMRTVPPPQIFRRKMHACAHDAVHLCPVSYVLRPRLSSFRNPKGDIALLLPRLPLGHARSQTT